MAAAALLCTALATPTAQAQIVNTEVRRLAADVDTLYGAFDVSYSYTKSLFELLVVGARAQTTWRTGNSVLLFVGDYQLRLINEADGVNSGFIHARYTYDTGENIVMPEGFLQVQRSPVQRIQVRFLGGAGLRLRLLETDSTNIYLGAAAMYEFENTSDKAFDLTLQENRDVRGSFYGSFGLALTPTVTFNSTTYFQPLFNDFGDFRLSSDNTINIGIKSWLSFFINYSISYDQNPPDDPLGGALQQTFYTMSTGLSFNW